MDWKELYLTEDNVKNNATFFHEEIGLNHSIRVSIYLLDNLKHKQDFYIQYNSGSFSQYSELSLSDLKYRIFLPEPAALKREKAKVAKFGGFFKKEFLPSEFIQYNPKNILVEIYGCNTEKTLQLELKDLSEISKIKIWMHPYSIERLIKPNFKDLEIGMKLYCPDYGLVKIKEICDHAKDTPNNDFVVDKKRKNHCINLGKSYCYRVPYDGFKQDIFNDHTNERLLDPHVSYNLNFNLVNIYWSPIEDAACYKVRFYKKNRDVQNGIDQLYFLKEVEVDHNTYFYSANDIILNNLVIVVLSEDRTGNVIAKSRGITDKIPRDFKFEDE